MYFSMVAMLVVHACCGQQKLPEVGANRNEEKRRKN